MSATSSASDPVTTVYELLKNADTSVWTNDDPQVRYMWDYSPQQRENENDPTLYVWSPVEGTYDKFSGDADSLTDDETVEISIWTLDATETSQYGGDLVDFMSDYMEDHGARVNWRNIEPDTINDLRAEHMAQRTNHFIAALQVTLDDLRDAGVS